MKMKMLTLSLTALALSTFSFVKADYPIWECCEPNFLSSAQPCGEDCGPFIGAEFLWLTTYETKTDYATDAQFVAFGEFEFDEPVGKFHHFRNEWDPGFRVTAGYRLGEDGWDARLAYTYFHNRSHNEATPSEGDRLLMNLYPSVITLSANGVEAKKSLNYNTGDFLFSRPYIVSCTHLLRPYFGVRGLWFTQKEHVRYENINGFLDNDGLVKWHSRIEAVGLHAGFEYVLNICDCLSLSADFGASLLAARQRQHYEANQVVTGTDTVVVGLADYTEKDLICLPGYQLGTALNWETEICCSCVVFSVGYEMHQWFNTPTIRRIDAFDSSFSSNNDSNLLIHGASVSAFVYF